jgi:hypothetical protein
MPDNAQAVAMPDNANWECSVRMILISHSIAEARENAKGDDCQGLF